MTFSCYCHPELAEGSVPNRPKNVAVEILSSTDSSVKLKRNLQNKVQLRLSQKFRMTTDEWDIIILWLISRIAMVSVKFVFSEALV